ncbi:MAG: methionyl-tRNA formyltransferase [Candidatus Omnitrophica bacterium]|nr:methionyl-tRNA formyltransferase [Candidatus Omnitrophota bacterium]
MNIVFLGSSEFSIPSLEALYNSQHNLVGVISRPDRPKGRGLEVSSTPVTAFARESNIPLYQPEDICAAESVQTLGGMKPDLLVIVSFGRILTRAVLDIPSEGTVNVHASLLPCYRGAAPVEWALVNGETETGVTIFRVTEKLDAGDIIRQKAVPISDADDAVSMAGKLGRAGAQALLESIRLIETGTARFQPQDEKMVTRAPKIRTQDRRTDWTRSSADIRNFIRGLTTVGCAYSFLKETRIAFWEARALPTQGPAAPPGTILAISPEEGIVVAAGKGVLSVLSLQRESGKQMNAYAFTLGHHVAVGDRFE